MKNLAQGVWRALLCVLLGWAGASDASTFTTGTNACAGCHGQPPTMLSQQLVTYQVGKIIPKLDDGALAQNCATTSNCSLRQKIVGNGNMGSTVANNFTPAELETIRQYLLLVRDGLVTAVAPTFTNTTVGASTTTPISFTIGNYRGTALNYRLSVTGADAGDFLIETPGGTCATTGNDGSVPGTSSASPSSCTVTASLRFRPTSAATRTASLQVTLTAANSNDADANVTGNQSIALSGLGIAANPAIQITPAGTLSLTATVGASTTGTLTVRNTGNANLVLTGLNVSPVPFSRDATSSCTSSTTLTPNSTCTVVVSFAPTAAGSTTGSVSITHNAAGSPSSVPLSGSATAAAAPAIQITPAGTLSLAATTGASTTGSLTVKNTGTANLVLTGLNVSPAPFSRDATSTCTSSSTLTPNSTCTVVVSFAPTADGSTTGSVNITHNAAGSPSAVALSGTATAAAAPAIDLGGVTALNFGTLGLGGTAVRSLTVRNSGAAALTISAFNITGPQSADFVRTGSCVVATAIPAAGSCTVDLTFSPAALGPRSASLSIVSNASNGTQVVGLAGDGAALAEPQLTPLPLPAFPLTLVGTTSGTTRVLSIQNPRGNAISYGRSLSGSNAADFAVVAESCVSRVVAPATTCTISLQFAPGAGAAARTANLALSFAGSGGDPAPAPVNVALEGTAGSAAPVFSINTNALSLNAVLGASGSGSAVITNTGTADLNLASLLFSGPAAGEFALAAGNTCSTSSVLLPSSSCTLVLRFTPAAVGTSNASLLIAHNASNSPQSLSLTGVATAVPQARANFSALSLSFANTQLASSTQQTITVQNSGDAPLVFSAFDFTGVAAADYARAGTCNSSTPLVPAAQCSLLISFQPSAVGVRNASLTVQSNASNGAATIALSGSGVAAPAPVLGVIPASLDFGSQTLAGTYPSRSLRLSNSGNTTLTLGAVVVSGAAFVNTSTGPGTSCPASLAPGEACTLAIRFNPTAADVDYTGSISISSNAAGSPQSVPLRGRGINNRVPVWAWSTASPVVDFGNVMAGAVSATQSINLQNLGPGGAVLTLLNAVGVDGAAFSVTTGSCAVGDTIFEGQSCRIDLRFAPASAGDKRASVQVVSTGSAPAELALRGTGLGGPSPGLLVSTTLLAFEDTRVGASSVPGTLSLMGSGSGVVRINSLTLTGPYSMQNKTCPAPPFTLAAGGECSITVSFVPQSEGQADGSLTVNTDATPNQRVLTLSARGQAAAKASSGGCSISQGHSARDPTLWALVLLAALALAYRRHARRKAAGAKP